jgi:hypothetical protein
MAKKRGPSKKAQRKGGRAAVKSPKSPVGGRGRRRSSSSAGKKGRKRGTTAGAKPGSGKNFRALKGKLARRKGVRNPGALAAHIGRKKYGAKRMAKMAAAGRRRRG